MTATRVRQEDVNRAIYASPRVYRYYLSRRLTPAEIACFEKYSAKIRGGDILDVGVGAGRTAYHLAPIARRYEAIDYSPVMVSYMRKTFSSLNVHQADFANLSIFPDSSFDFVFAADNVIDALSHENRLRALRESARVLRPGGILAFTSHNLHYKRALSPPWFDWSANPIRLAMNCAKYALSWWNHIRVGRLRRITPEYALLNDRGHHYAILHYYLLRSAVRSQLAATGLRFIEAFTPQGTILRDSDDDSDCASLLYVAQTGVAKTA